MKLCYRQFENVVDSIPYLIPVSFKTRIIVLVVSAIFHNSRILNNRPFCQEIKDTVLRLRGTATPFNVTMATLSKQRGLKALVFCR